MRPDSVGPKAPGQSLTPRTARPPLQKTTRRYPHQGLGSGAAPVRSFKPAPPGGEFTPRSFRREANVEDRIPAPTGAGEADAFDLQKELPSQPSRPDALGHDGFGIPSHDLDAARNAIEPQFQRFYQRAADREASKREKSYYVEKTRTATSADGSAWEEKVWERREEKRSVKLQAWQAEKGRNIQTGLNKVDRLMREKTGRPRKTGSNYASDRAKDDLMTPGKQTLNDNAAGTVAVAVALNQGPTNYAAHEDPAAAADLTPVADDLAALAVLPAVLDAGFGAAAYLGLHSEQEKAKQALNLKNDARRFLVLQAEATPEEAENYLKFMAAGGKLFEPTLEDASIMNAAGDRVVRTGVATPLQSVGGAALEIANTAATVTPMANVALAPIAIARGVVSVVEGSQELLRRVDQKARAEGRQERMKAVLEAFKDHPEHELLEGLVNCLDAQQDRLIQQATGEKKYARGRIFEGGGTIGGVLGGLAALGAMAGVGALTTVTGGAAAIPLTALAAGWGALAAKRNHERAVYEHKSKWRQRAMRALEFEMPREELEQKLAGTHPAGSDVEVHFQEGDYLPEEQRFAGSREMKFDARENEYLALHVLALQVQDIVKNHNYDRNSPYVRLLEALGIDAIKLLAICKAASAKPENAQLDFIKSHLALASGIKLRMEGGVQALPHASVFLRHFESARRKALAKVEKITSNFGHSIRKELAAYYPDSIAGLEAFDKAVGTFLSNVARPSETDMPGKIFMEELKDVVKAGEVDEPIRQLEQFRWAGPPHRAATP